MNGPATPRLTTPLAADDVLPAALAQVIVQAPVAMALIGTDQRYELVNAAYARLLGRSAAELIGRHFAADIVTPDPDQLIDRHRTCVAGTASTREEWDLRRADGSVRCVIAESMPAAAPGGTVQRLVHAVDISLHRKLERGLQQSQVFLQSVLDGLSSHVCVLDEHGHILAVNRAWREFGQGNGAPPDVVWEGMSYLAVCDRTGVDPGFAQQLRDVLAGHRQGFQAEYPCHSPDEQRWFVARVSRIAGESPTRIVIAHNDVSALKQAQDTLRRSEARFRDLAASTPGALFRLLRGADGSLRFDYLSPGVSELFGVDAETACSDPTALWARVLPEDRAAFDAALAAAADYHGPWEHEWRVLGADGCLKWVHARAAPQPVDAGMVAWTGMLMDISERKRLEAGLKTTEETFRTLFETVPQGVVYQDRDGFITSANPAAERILGLTLAQLQGRSSVDPRWHAIHEDGSPFPGEEHPAMVALRTGRPVEDVVMGVAVPDRGQIWILVNATPLFRHGVLEQVYSTFEDISARVALSQELRLQASTDFLTGCANRRSLIDRLTVEFERTRRHPERVCSVMALDLDMFKQVNDQWGHATGDAVLVHMSALMKQASRAADLVARSGGEEFTLLLPDTSADDARTLGERLRERIAATPMGHDGQALRITVSIGISTMTAADHGIDAVLARADRALYQAKAEGRNTVRVCLPPI
jgi:diguanylate cyclase (GGDEF)-like protein/PAS domain S-box-containing protein